jgi:hypothetical protein
VFVGHGRSLVWYQLKNFLSARLQLTCHEFNSEAMAGISTTERLQTLLDDLGFAFLLMTAEHGHADGGTHARENVVHEIGLFQGRLGFRRAIVLLEEGCAEFSNIHGLTYIGFPKGNLEPKFEEIRRVLEREGLCIRCAEVHPISQGQAQEAEAETRNHRKLRKQQVLDSLRRSSQASMGNCLRALAGSDEDYLYSEMEQEGQPVRSPLGYMLPESTFLIGLSDFEFRLSGLGDQLTCAGISAGLCSNSTIA